jgi:uncharacterized protein
LVCAGPLSRAAEVIPPPPPAYFNDFAGVVSRAVAAGLNSQLDQFERSTSNQVLVAIYPHMQSDSSIEDYTVRIAQAWGVGQSGKKNGAVLFVFAQDHTLFIQVGYGLEGALPDALCKRIIDGEIVPRLHAGDFDGAMQAGVQAILAATRGEYKGNGTTDADAGDQRGLPLPFIILIVLVMIVLSVVRSFQHVVYSGVGRRSTWSGGGPWLFMGGGGGGSGGGFGGGGFSGGGGSFGGGGAGGHW